MRAFAGGYYNNLRAMYDYLGVSYRPQPFLFAFESLKSGRATPYFIHASNHHRLPPLKPKGISMHTYVLEILYLVVWYAYFTLCCMIVRPRTTATGETLQEYLARIRIPRYFTTNYVLPLISSVTTCPHKVLLQFPACDVINYKRRTNGAQHYTISNGVGDAQKGLAHGIEPVLSARVLSVIPQSGGGVSVNWRHTEDKHILNPSVEVFDIVVLAVSPDIVGQIFEPLKDDMARIPTIRVESTVHRDDSALRDHSALFDKKGTSQTVVLRTARLEGETESVHLQPSGAIVTTCPFIPIEPESIIQTSTFTRVLRTPESRSIINNIFDTKEIDRVDDEKMATTEKCSARWRNGSGGVWLAGGWCWDGMVLLEGCVVSAMRIAEDLGVEVPWKVMM
jgi:hypothetical protein